MVSNKDAGTHFVDAELAEDASSGLTLSSGTADLLRAQTPGSDRGLRALPDDPGLPLLAQGILLTADEQSCQNTAGIRL